MNEITYSVIIPHKDIPQLLQRCLASIPQREDVQIIVVDDNSDPEKVDFAHFPGLERPDVECYFPKEGKGAGYARNIGLKHAKGKWLLFADADDFFHPDLLDILDPWKDSTRDIVYFETYSVDSDTLEPIAARIQLHTSEMTREDMENSAEWVYPVGKMVRNSLVQTHHILFDEVRWSNDVMFSTQCSYYAGKNVDICGDLLYCATDRKNSLWTEVMSEEHLMCRLKVAVRVERFAQKHHMSIVKFNNEVPFSFYYVGQFRLLGADAHRRAKLYYLKHSCLSVLLQDLLAIVRFKIRHAFGNK